MFVDIIVPVSVPNTYTYGVPLEIQDEIKIGQRVEIQFGKRKRYSGVVLNIHSNKPAEYDAKPIISIIDQIPLIKKNQLRLWQWISQYYMANIGDVMSVALPSALKLSSESSIQLVMENDVDINDLTDDEYLVFEALSNQHELKVDDVQLILGKKNVFPTLQLLMQRRLIAMKENLKKKYKPKKKSFVRLSEVFQNEESKHDLLDQLERAPKQQEIVLLYLSKYKKNQWIEKSKFLEEINASSSTLKALVEKNIFDEEKRSVERIHDNGEGDLSATLSDAQQVAYEKIISAFNKNKTCLLHGVTGSGKTHIYIKLIEQAISEGKQVLYLLPEIALTSQIIKRLKNHFGKDVGVYHSKFNDAERVEIWNKTLNEQYKVILGARSAIFLPFKKLGLIVVDEEHDTSYKQFDPSPRYNARDVALYLSSQLNANILLGTATPSFESYFNAEQGKYELIELNERFGDIQLPTIEIVNLLKQNIPGKNYNNFSKRLIDELRKVVDEKKQAILFRNRRGYSSFVQCNACASNIKCENCDVSLTYHKYRDQLECHYCGFKQKIPYRCPACGHNELHKIGLGTERIQEELNVFLPNATFGRMDLDTTRNKHGHEKIISRFEQKEIDVLVGTQMVTKGLHFNDVTLVGIINADAILKFPDFRAGERAFQLMEQVSGRAGRTKEKGLVIIQVRDENDFVLKFVQNHDYHGLYKQAIKERWKWKYPPFYRLIKITMKHKDWKTNYQAAIALALEIRNHSNQIVKGPGEPLVSKVNNYFIQEIMITIQKKAAVLSETKQLIQEKIDYIQNLKGNSQLRINVDVDPI